MSAADWYARKLGGQQQPQQQQPSTPPTGPQYQQPPAYVPPYQPASPYHGQQSGQQVAPGPPQDPKSVSEAWQMPLDWHQGRRSSDKAGEVYSCPQCGDENFFTRNGMGNVAGMAPAPCCHACGYNGRFTQFGSLPENQ